MGIFWQDFDSLVMSLLFLSHLKLAGCSIIKETANSVILSSCARLRLSIRSILSSTGNLRRCHNLAIISPALTCWAYILSSPCTYPQQQSQTMSIYFIVRRLMFKTEIRCVYHVLIIITDAPLVCTSSSIHYEEPGPAFNNRRKVGLARRRQNIYFLPGGSSQRR